MEYKDHEVLVINGITIRTKTCVLSEEDEHAAYVRFKKVLIDKITTDKTA